MNRHSEILGDTGCDNGVIHTTVGDLVEAVTQIALKAAKSQEEGYQLASLTLQKMLRHNRKELLSIARA